MNIVFYNHTGTVSGAERVLLSTVQRLQSDQRRFTLVCPEQGTLASEAERLGVNVFLVPALEARFTANPLKAVCYLASILKTTSFLRRTLLRLSPDLIHANSVRAGIVATLATIGTRLKVLWHVHDILPRHPFSTATKLVACLSSRTSLVACSQAAAQPFSHSKLHSAGKSCVVHNGVDIQRLVPDDNVRNSTRRSLGFDPNHCVFGIVGQICSRKGQLGLVKAFHQVLRSVPNARLVIVGSPMFKHDHEYFSALRTEITRLELEDRVQLVGHRSDVPALMQSLDVFVLNSLVEPFSLVLLEAMALGKQVVATDSGGASEVISHGRNGLLIPTNDLESLVHALIQTGTDPALRAACGREARLHISAKFRTEKYARELLEVYAKTANGISDVPAKGLEHGYR